MAEQRRENYRINYPESLRPSILIENKTYKVIDISINSLKFTTDNTEIFSVGNIFSGNIKFYDDAEFIDFKGQILRVVNDEIIVFLEKPISLQRIKLENIFIAYRLQLLLMSNLAASKQSV